MTVFIALLRGVNVGGKKAPMADFRALLVDIGFSHVCTFIQSGNAVFESGDGDCTLLAARIEAAFAPRFGFAARCMVVTAAELEQVLRQNPYRAEAADPTKVHVGFADVEPNAASVAALEGKPHGPDRLQLNGRTIYLHTPDGMGRSVLAPFIERTLKVSITFRNWRTVEALAAMVSG